MAWIHPDKLAGVTRVLAPKLTESPEAAAAQAAAAGPPLVPQRVAEPPGLMTNLAATFAQQRSLRHLNNAAVANAHGPQGQQEKAKAVAPEASTITIKLPGAAQSQVG